MFSKNDGFVIALLLAALCLAGYGASLGHGFMLDDHVVLFGEKGVANKSLLSLFTAEQHIFYRPVGHIPLLIFHRVFGVNAAGYHAANLGLFFIICWLFFRLTEALTGKRLLAFLAAAFYALHPVNSMLVNYVTANIISVFVITLQLSFLFYWKYLVEGKRAFLAASLVFLSLSLLSHEMSMMMPAYAFCAAYFLRGMSVKESLRACWPYAVVTAVYFFFRWQFFSLRQPIEITVQVAGIFDLYIASIMSLIYWYVSKLFFPLDILFLWTHRITENFFTLEYLRLAAILGLLVYLIVVRWKRGLSSFALSVLVLGFLPVFWAGYAHFPATDPMIEPHWFYFSSWGFFLLLAQGLARLREQGMRRAAAVTACFFLLAYGTLLQENNRWWKDQSSYCRRWLSLNPANMTPFYGLGMTLLQNGDAAGAVRLLEQGMSLSNVHGAYILADLGQAHFLNGDADAAMRYLDKAVETEPGYSRSYYYRGLVHRAAGRADLAQADIRKAFSLYPAKEYLQATAP